jgi:ABC-type lipoprotein export system ATPase subunit
MTEEATATKTNGQSPPTDAVETVIETRDMWRIYKSAAQEVQALRGVNLQIGRGHFVALVGRSGSGKTTLLNIVGGLDQATKGEVRIFGRELSKMNERKRTQWRRKQVGFVFQSFGLLPTLSAYENVELMPRIAGMKARQRKERTLYCLELVGLKKWMHHRPYEMSGGQQQRVAIARALANQPQLILADEPTGELDTSTAREILSLFQHIVTEEGVTILMVSHDNLVYEYVDQVLRLRDGEIVEEN